MDNHEHIRDVLQQYAEDFRYEQKRSSRDFNGQEIRLFDDQLRYFLLQLIAAAIKDGCPRRWLVQLCMCLADEALVAFRPRTPEGNAIAADILLKEASDMASVRKGEHTTSH